MERTRVQLWGDLRQLPDKRTKYSKMIGKRLTASYFGESQLRAGRKEVFGGGFFKKKFRCQITNSLLGNDESNEGTDLRMGGEIS